MTRINIVDVTHLTDEHLRGEYTEITRPFTKMKKRLMKYGETLALSNIRSPRAMYVLNEGHESFFFDKLLFLRKRYAQLKDEMIRRGFKVNTDLHNQVVADVEHWFSDTPFWNDYSPSPEEIYLNMARLVRRSKIPMVTYELQSMK